MRSGIRASFTGPTGMSPALVAEQVIGAVLSDRFWVLPHGDMRPMLQARFDEILGELPR